MIKLLVFLCILSLAAGCKEVYIGGPDQASLPFETLKKGNYGFGFGENEIEHVVIKSRGEWVAFWKNAGDNSIFAEGGPKPYIDPDPFSEQMTTILPNVNFRRETVIGVFSKGFSPGDSVSIVNIARKNRQLIVKIEHHMSREGIENTAPYQIVKIDEPVDLPVLFDIVEK